MAGKLIGHMKKIVHPAFFNSRKVIPFHKELPTQRVCDFGHSTCFIPELISFLSK